MKYIIRKNWLSTADFIIKNRMIIFPFVIIAFVETIALELIYFSVRSPISLVMNPIIRKFFGEEFLHYPVNLVLLSRLFYYAQMVIYILLGVFLTATSVTLFKNIKAALPIKANAIIRTLSRRYILFIGYGITMIVFIVLIKRMDIFIFSKVMRLVSKLLPQISPKLSYTCLTVFLFLTNIILQTLVMLTVPIMVIQGKSLPRAMAKSIYLGIRNFRTIFALISLPFLIYLPSMLLKSFSVELAGRTFPEINLYITAFGIVISIFVDSFLIICVSQFLLDKEGTASVGAA